MDSVPVICDYGSGFSKVGFAGSEVPSAVFPTVLGRLQHRLVSAAALRSLNCKDVLTGMEEENCLIGSEAQNKREQVFLQCPISRGAVTSWDNLEKIWHHSFYQALHIVPEQHPLMVTEPPLNPTSAREKVSQILFETFNIPALYLANQGVLSLYASGQTAGTTIESGEGMTYSVPVSDGYPLHQSVIQLDVAGQDLTLYLLKLLADRGNMSAVVADREYIRDAKERCCYAALDFNEEKVKASPPSSCQQKIQLPDGQEVSLGQEAFFCPEALFQTSLIGRNTLGIHTLAIQSITSCNPALWRTLFGHIVLSGGTGTCSGLRSRLQRELIELVSPTLEVRVPCTIPPPKTLLHGKLGGDTILVSTCLFAKYGAWVGGSILSSLSTFKDMWVTRSEYQDIGSSSISRRSL
ncbi:actin, aortic smooth muscle-like [Ctenodactylus gundi]